MNYYRFQVEQQKCDTCGWVGTGAGTERGETFESLFEFHGPACHVKLGICTCLRADGPKLFERAT